MGDLPLRLEWFGLGHHEPEVARLKPAGALNVRHLHHCNTVGAGTFSSYERLAAPLRYNLAVVSVLHKGGGGNESLCGVRV